MKRPVAVAAASIDAVNAVHANVIHERNDRRGIEDFAAGGLAAGAGFGGAGLDGVGDSSLLIGISHKMKE